MESAKFALCSLPKVLGSGMFAIFGQQNGQKLPIYIMEVFERGYGGELFPKKFSPTNLSYSTTSALSITMGA